MIEGNVNQRKKKEDKSQLPDTGSVVGSACFVDGFAEELVVQLIGRFDLQFDGKVLSLTTERKQILVKKSTKNIENKQSRKRLGRTKEPSGLGIFTRVVLNVLDITHTHTHTQNVTMFIAFISNGLYR